MERCKVGSSAKLETPQDRQECVKLSQRVYTRVPGNGKCLGTTPSAAPLFVFSTLLLNDLDPDWVRRMGARGTGESLMDRRSPKQRRKNCLFRLVYPPTRHGPLTTCTASPRRFPRAPQKTRVILGFPRGLSKGTGPIESATGGSNRDPVAGVPHGCPADGTCFQVICSLLAPED